MNLREKITKEIEAKNGILRCKPTWVHRTFLPPGRRLKLDNYDLYDDFGKHGGICERWMASSGMADNGATTRENEGLTFIVLDDGSLVSLRDAVKEAGDVILGADIMKKFGCLLSFCKLYDYQAPIHFHVHLKEDQAQKVGAHSKPEAYFFPKQLNPLSYNGDFTFFGFEPGTKKSDIVKCLENWAVFGGDNGILDYSRAYKLKLDTGWNIPAGILHAPGSLVTYEPQRVSDCSAFFQSIMWDHPVSKDLLTGVFPKDKQNNMAYIVDSLDWEANVDPEFKKNHYHEPVHAVDPEASRREGYLEDWIVYGADDFAAKELTVLPGKTVVIKDKAAYGILMLEGYGTINGVPIETPAVIGINDITADEFYVCRDAAEKGVEIKNLSKCSKIVMMKHFGPDNPDAKKFLQ
jgi:mannose-6-phosphate isomerase class I